MKTKLLIPLFTLPLLLVTSATAQVNYAVSDSTVYVTDTQQLAMAAMVSAASSSAPAGQLQILCNTGFGLL